MENCKNDLFCQQMNCLTFHRRVPDLPVPQHQPDFAHVGVNEAIHHASMEGHTSIENHSICRRQTGPDDKHSPSLV